MSRPSLTLRERKAPIFLIGPDQPGSEGPGEGRDDRNPVPVYYKNDGSPDVFADILAPFDRYVGEQLKKAPQKDGGR